MARLVMILFSLQDAREQKNAETIHVGQDNVQNFCDELEEKSILGMQIHTYLLTVPDLRYLSKERENS